MHFVCTLLNGYRCVLQEGWLQKQNMLLIYRSLQYQKSTVPLLCISLLLSYYMFRINCHQQGANTYIIKTQFTINIL